MQEQADGDQNAGFINVSGDEAHHVDRCQSDFPDPHVELTHLNRLLWGRGCIVSSLWGGGPHVSQRGCLGPALVLWTWGEGDKVEQEGSESYSWVMHPEET